jgi:hypothetical protein
MRHATRSERSHIITHLNTYSRRLLVTFFSLCSRLTQSRACQPIIATIVSKNLHIQPLFMTAPSAAHRPFGRPPPLLGDMTNEQIAQTRRPDHFSGRTVSVATPGDGERRGGGDVTPRLPPSPGASPPRLPGRPGDVSLSASRNNLHVLATCFFFHVHGWKLARLTMYASVRMTVRHSSSAGRTRLSHVKTNPKNMQECRFFGSRLNLSTLRVTSGWR